MIRPGQLSGLYFVVDPTMERERLLKVLEGALKGGVDLIQVWAAWKKREDFVGVVKDIKKIAGRQGVPLIINNDTVMARTVGADGVHMDRYDLSPSQIRQALGKDCLVGYTTGNDVERVVWAERSGADYVSFCSIFPSPSVTECELVPLQTVKRSREVTALPIFASGGITLANAKQVLESGADGVAVISAIQKADDPEGVARRFKDVIASVESQRRPRKRAHETFKNRAT